MIGLWFIETGLGGHRIIEVGLPSRWPSDETS
jgi:hypothetical protein